VTKWQSAEKDERAGEGPTRKKQQLRKKPAAAKFTTSEVAGESANAENAGDIQTAAEARKKMVV